MILAVIVTYNPDIKRLLENINSIKNQVNQILIVDNNSKNIEKIKQIITSKNIIFLSNQTNQGIAKALNQSLDYAIENKYKYLLTLDQDSISKNRMVHELKKGFRYDNNVGIVSPKIYDINTKKIMSKDIEQEFQEIETTITSGSLCDVKKIHLIGKFDENLFIDCVDFEICLRMKKNGYKTLLAKNIVLNHEVGKSVIKKILGIKFVITNHTPFRIYYIFRNNIYINEIYYKKNTKKYINNYLKLVKKVIGILLYEKEVKLKLKEVINGCIDAKKILKIQKND